MRLDLWGGTSGSYAGFDRFGRTISHKWEDYGSTSTVAEINHGYDRASNRLYRENTQTTGKDELYSYDGLDRLDDTQRGDLNANKDAISTLAFEQDWGLTQTGNWATFDEDISARCH